MCPCERRVNVGVVWLAEMLEMKVTYLSPCVFGVPIGADVMTFWFPLALVAALHDLSAAASHEPFLVWGHVIERGSIASRAALCFKVATAHTPYMSGGMPSLLDGPTCSRHGRAYEPSAQHTAHSHA